MKKLIVLILTALMCASLVGCSKLTEQQQLVADTVNTFMDETGDDMVRRYADDIGIPPRPISVINAVELRLGNCDGNGNNAHCLLIALTGDIAGDGWCDNGFRLLLDLDTNKLYNSVELDWDLISGCDGMPTNEEEFNNIALNAYHNYVSNGAPQLMSDSEIREELTQEDLDAINAALK